MAAEALARGRAEAKAEAKAEGQRRTAEEAAARKEVESEYIMEVRGERDAREAFVRLSPASRVRYKPDKLARGPWVVVPGG